MLWVGFLSTWLIAGIVISYAMGVARKVDEEAAEMWLEFADLWDEIGDLWGSEGLSKDWDSAARSEIWDKLEG